MFGLSVIAAKTNSIINSGDLEVKRCHEKTHTCGSGFTVRWSRHRHADWKAGGGHSPGRSHVL